MNFNLLRPKGNSALFSDYFSKNTWTSSFVTFLVTRLCIKKKLKLVLIQGCHCFFLLTVTVKTPLKGVSTLCVPHVSLDTCWPQTEALNCILQLILSLLSDILPLLMVTKPLCITLLSCLPLITYYEEYSINIT